MKFFLTFFCLITVTVANIGLTYPIPFGSTNSTNVCSKDTDLTADPNPCTNEVFIFSPDEPLSDTDICGFSFLEPTQVLIRTPNQDPIDLKLYQRDAQGGSGTYNFIYFIDENQTVVKSWSQDNITNGNIDNTELTLSINLGSNDIGSDSIPATGAVILNTSDGTLFASCFDFVYRGTFETDDCEFESCCQTVGTGDTDFCGNIGEKVCFPKVAKPTTNFWTKNALDFFNNVNCSSDLDCPENPDEEVYCDKDNTFKDITKEDYCNLESCNSNDTIREINLHVFCTSVSFKKCSNHNDCGNPIEPKKICFEECKKCYDTESCEERVKYASTAREGDTDCISTNGGIRVHIFGSFTTFFFLAYVGLLD